MKKIYLMAVLSLIFNNLQSQNFSWAKRAGLWAYDYGYGIVNDNSGNVYVAGKYEETADFSGTTVPCQGNHDIFLAKYNPSGALTWVRTGGGGSGDYAHAIACDGDSNVYVAGEIEGCDSIIVFPGSSITLKSMCDNDIFLTKYDLDGNLLWARRAGGYKGEKAVGVTYDSSGNVFICGYYIDTCTFGGVATIYGQGKEDIFVAKYDRYGNFKWVHNAGSVGRDEPKSIQCDAAGNVYVCGFYSNGAVFGSQTLASPGGNFETFLAKYSNSGSLLWVKTAGGNWDDVSWSLTMDNAGLLYVTGEFNGSALFGATTLYVAGRADVFVACYDTSGTVQWAKRAGGILDDRARGIGCDGTNIFITGQFGGTASFGSYTLNAADSSDIFFASLTNTGNFIGALSVGGAPDSLETLGYESGVAICAEASGNVYGTGAMLQGGDFGSTTLTQYSRTDVYVTKMSQLTGINTPATNSETISIYPNPNPGNFTIVLNQLTNKKTETTVLNCFGQIVSKRTDKSISELNVDLSAQESGIYFIEVKTDDQKIQREKIIVQK